MAEHHRGARHGGPSCAITGCPQYDVWWRRVLRKALGIRHVR